MNFQPKKIIPRVALASLTLGYGCDDDSNSDSSGSGGMEAAGGTGGMINTDQSGLTAAQGALVDSQTDFCAKVFSCDGLNVAEFFDSSDAPTSSSECKSYFEAYAADEDLPDDCADAYALVYDCGTDLSCDDLADDGAIAAACGDTLLDAEAVCPEE